MPFNELQRRDSWPPTIVRIRDDEATSEETSAIDENPFSFFLTSPEDIDDDLEDLSAGIESSSKSPQVRSVSPSTIQRTRPLLEADDDDEEDEEYEYGLGAPLSLREFTVKHAEGRKSRQEKRTEDMLAGLGIALPDFSDRRGRATVSTPPRFGRGRGQTRSLSARRPHSWRLPSPEIGTIKEERESDDGEETLQVPKQEKCMSAPPSPEVRKSTIAKLKKRVHWAL